MRAAKAPLALFVIALASPAGGQVQTKPQDPVDVLVQQGALPPDIAPRRGYSDFSDPLGRFMDMMAAGSFSEAKALRPAACERWRATRTQSGWTGKFWAADRQLDLDDVCQTR
jgi:hypothetical protein